MSVNYKHGYNGTRLYGIWSGIKTRCLNNKNHSYKNYGDRGITISDEWLEFENFKNWAIKNGYNDMLTIDRKDNMNGYYPENCRFVTEKEQANNKTNNKIIEYRNDNHTMAEWADILNISYQTLWARLFKYNWEIEKAFTTPVRGRIN